MLGTRKWKDSYVSAKLTGGDISPVPPVFAAPGHQISGPFRDWTSVSLVGIAFSGNSGSLTVWSEVQPPSGAVRQAQRGELVL